MKQRLICLFVGCFLMGAAESETRLPEKVGQMMGMVNKLEKSIPKQVKTLKERFGVLTAEVDNKKTSSKKVRKELKNYIKLKERLLFTAKDYKLGIIIIRKSIELTGLNRAQLQSYTAWQLERTRFLLSLQQQSLTGISGMEEDRVLEKAFDIGYPGMPNPVREKNQEKQLLQPQYRITSARQEASQPLPYFVSFSASFSFSGLVQVAYLHSG